MWCSHHPSHTELFFPWVSYHTWILFLIIPVLSCLPILCYGYFFSPKETVSSWRARVLPSCLLSLHSALWVMSAWWPLATIAHASTSYSCSEQCFLKSGDLTCVLFASFCARGYRGGVNQAKQSPQTLGPLILLSGLLCHSQIPGSFLGISPVAHFLRPWGLGWIWDFLGPSCLMEKSWKPERCQDPK